MMGWLLLYLSDELVFFEFHFSLKRLQLLLLHVVEGLPLGAVLELEAARFGEARSDLIIKY